jgi:peptidyl-dipeptidase A
MKKGVFSVCAVIILTALSAILITSCGGEKNKDMNEELKTFIKDFEGKYIPLYTESCEAYWTASISGKEEDFAKAAAVQYEITKIFSDKASFESLKKIKESNSITDPLLSRQLTVIYNAFAGQQIDTAKLKQMIDMQSKIEMKFTNFRATVDKDSLTDNMVEEVLRTSTDNAKLEATWKASKKSGANVAEDIKALVKLRNEAAKELGYSNYHEMSLKLSEQDPAEIEKLFDELDSLTRDAFAQLKNEMDDYFSKLYKVQKQDLMPWHYQNRFFQEAPQIYAVDMDVYYKDQDLVNITSAYFKGIGLDIDDLVKNSDLFEKPGKNQHAYCIDVNKKGDVRVLCNVKPNANWMNTMLHEYGHAVYGKFNDTILPFVLRDAAHIFTTEAVAMFFGRMASNPGWMVANAGVKEEEAAKIAEDCKKTLRLEQLVFSRWSQVMYRFEKSLYENPDQDLNKLWWTLVEKYQMVKPPADRNEADWASKIHIATSPCYYHNYLLGELLASQFTYYLAKNIYKTDDLGTINWTANPEVGKFFVDKVFKPGMRLEWNSMIEQATGEKLTAQYYAKQFVN